MVEGFDRRVYLPDTRGGDRYLRVTWHSDTATVVVSHWRGEICVASAPISLDDATRLSGPVVEALKEKATVGMAVGPARAAKTGRLLARLRERFSPPLAQIVGLPERAALPSE